MTLLEGSQLLGNLGEFIGGIAIIITLIYLGIQVRHGRQAIDQSNRLAELTAMDEARRAFSAFRLLLAADPEVARIWDTGRPRPQELNDGDRSRFFVLVREYHNIMRTNYVRTRALKQSDDAAAGPDVTVESWAQQLYRYPGLREIVQQPENDPTGFNAEIEKRLRQIESQEAA